MHMHECFYGLHLDVSFLQVNLCIGKSCCNLSYWESSWLCSVKLVPGDRYVDLNIRSSLSWFIVVPILQNIVLNEIFCNF